MKHLLLIGFIQALSTLAFAQTTYPGGLILDDEAYLSVASSSAQISPHSGQKYNPVRVDLTPYCPEVRHQGDISSCVGWSAGYAAMTIERAVQQQWTDQQFITEQASSALFVYNQVSGTDCQAIRMPDALKTMQEKGNCLAREFDFDVNDCGKSASEDILASAATYRIEEFIRLFAPNDDGSRKIQYTKMLLAQNKPVIVGMKILNNFYNLPRGTESWFPGIGDQTYAGGHAMVVVGYDDQKFASARTTMSPDTKGAFKIMNSWGKNWGEQGFIWIRYADFAEYCRHAYAIQLERGSPIDLNFSEETSPEQTDRRMLRSFAGSFGFRLYTGQWLNGKPLFAEQEVKLVDNHYVLDDRQIGDQFQLYVSSEYLDGYIYVFSVDPAGKAEVHFPKSRLYDQSYTGTNESAMFIGNGSTLVVPGSESALTLNHPGEDHLIVLFSDRKIKPRYIEVLASTLTKKENDLEQVLPGMLQKHMVPFADINYYPDRMGFEVSTRSDGSIVPIMLKVSTR